MGLLVLLGAGAALVVLGGPCAVLAILVCRQAATRTRSFWLPCLVALLFGVAAQYAVAIAPFTRAKEYDFGLFFAPMWGWHLLGPPAIAAALWSFEPARERPAVLGVVAGLLFSVPGLVALAIPLGVVAAAVLGLHFQH